MAELLALTHFWRLCIVNNTPMLLQVRRGGEWHSIRVAREFTGIHAAIYSLEIFARQQKVDLADARVRALRSVEQVLAAECAVEEYNARI